MTQRQRELTQEQATRLLLAGAPDPRPADPTPRPGVADSAKTADAFAAEWDIFFTGKPKVEGLGHVFAFRNYRPGLQKWQTTDPLGYPDGFNNTAYVNNAVSFAIDPLGLEWHFQKPAANQIKFDGTPSTYSYWGRSGTISYGYEISANWVGGLSKTATVKMTVTNTLTRPLLSNLSASAEIAFNLSIGANGAVTVTGDAKESEKVSIDQDSFSIIQSQAMATYEDKATSFDGHARFGGTHNPTGSGAVKFAFKLLEALNIKLDLTGLSDSDSYSTKPAVQWSIKKVNE